jgi:hypothetical protein
VIRRCVLDNLDARGKSREAKRGRVEKMEEKQQPTYASDHLYLVAFLTCTGHNIVRTRRHGHRVAFEFAETPELLADVARFMGGAAIPARQFSFEVLKLKRTLNGG